MTKEITLQRAFELGALAMRQSCRAVCGNETESLMEGQMTDAGLTKEDKAAMTHQINAIDEVSERMAKETPDTAAHYGSYILQEEECAEIQQLFPKYAKKKETVDG